MKKIWRFKDVGIEDVIKEKDEEGFYARREKSETFIDRDEL